MAYGNNNKADNMDLSRTNRVPGLMKKREPVNMMHIGMIVLLANDRNMTQVKSLQCTSNQKSIIKWSSVIQHHNEKMFQMQLCRSLSRAKLSSVFSLKNWMMKESMHLKILQMTPCWESWQEHWKTQPEFKNVLPSRKISRKQ